MRDNPRFDATQISERMGVPRKHVQQLIAFLVATGLAEQCGSRPSDRGRGENVYQFANDFERILALRLQRANLT